MSKPKDLTYAEINDLCFVLALVDEKDLGEGADRHKLYKRLHEIRESMEKDMKK